ncbi:uncharacterized protein LAJ45_06690 [Morchella importuna]|nr:uncharacterized protein LAJ45_06690 [Morchella importuna]KAH8149151.1 hypothetical protein LAJ45_06690 [Morchella importuna]
MPMQPIGLLSYDHIISILCAFSSFGDLYKFAALNRGFYSIFSRYRTQIEHKVAQNFIGDRESWENAKVILIYQRAATLRMSAPAHNFPYRLENTEVPEAALKEKFVFMPGELRRLVFHNFVFTQCINAYDPILEHGLDGPVDVFYHMAAVAFKRVYIPGFNVVFNTGRLAPCYSNYITKLLTQNLLDMKFWAEFNSRKNATICILMLEMVYLVLRG